MDLRLWFYSYGPEKWTSCEYPGLESSVHSGALYCYGTEAITAAQGAYFAALVDHAVDRLHDQPHSHSEPVAARPQQPNYLVRNCAGDGGGGASAVCAGTE